MSSDINDGTDEDVAYLNKINKKNQEHERKVDTNISDLVTNNQEMKVFFMVQNRAAVITKHYTAEQINPNKKIYVNEADLSTTQKLLIDSAIRDTIAFSIWNRENEALTWIHAKLGYWINRQYFQTRLEVLKNDKDTQRWLDDLAREGFTRQFMIAHNRLEDMTAKDMSMLETLYKRFERGDKEAVREITALQKTVTDMIKVGLVVINNVPMIPQLKAFIESGQQKPLVQIEKEAPQPVTKQDIKETIDETKVIDVEQQQQRESAEPDPNNSKLPEVQSTDELREPESGEDKQTVDVGFEGDADLQRAASPGEVGHSRGILPERNKSGFNKTLRE